MQRDAMANFYGLYPRSVDSKGRVILPSRVREQLALTEGTSVYLSLGNNNCIAVYAERDWEEKSARLKRNQTANTRAYIRLLFAHTVRVTPDKQGRVPIPPSLMQYAGIDVETARDLVFAGALTHFEVWEQGRWGQFNAENEASATLDEHGDIEFGRDPQDTVPPG